MLEALNARIHTAGAPLANPAPDERNELLALYDAEIAYADHHLGAVLDALTARRLRRGTLTVVTSDHGEEFLDHGDFGHGPQVYQEQARVPLIVRLPRGRRGGPMGRPPIAECACTSAAT